MDEPALSFVQNYGRHGGVALRTEFASYVRWDAGKAWLRFDPAKLAAHNLIAAITAYKRANLKNRSLA